MAQVGIRAFKAELSRYLRQVRSGRPVLVTDRGQVIAQVSAPSPAAKGAGAQGQRGTATRLAALVERGILRPAVPAATERACPRSTSRRAHYSGWRLKVILVCVGGSLPPIVW